MNLVWLSEVVLLLSILHMGAMAPSIHRQPRDDTQPVVADSSQDTPDPRDDGDQSPAMDPVPCQQALTGHIDRCLVTFEAEWAVANGGRSISASGDEQSWIINGHICWEYEQTLQCLFLRLSVCSPEEEHLMMIATRIGMLRSVMERRCTVRPEDMTPQPTSPSTTTPLPAMTETSTIAHQRALASQMLSTRGSTETQHTSPATMTTTVPTTTSSTVTSSRPTQTAAMVETNTKAHTTTKTENALDQTLSRSDHSMQKDSPSVIQPQSAADSATASEGQSVKGWTERTETKPSGLSDNKSPFNSEALDHTDCSGDKCQQQAMAGISFPGDVGSSAPMSRVSLTMLVVWVLAFGMNSSGLL